MTTATPDQADSTQRAHGSYIAQADRGGTAMVVVYQAAAPAPVGRATLARAEALLAELPLDVVPPPAGLPSGSRLPLLPNALFVGREPDLRALAAALKAGGTAAVGQSTAVTGMGGVGKTQLACEFAWRYGRYFAGGVFWLGCADPAAIPAEIAACGRGLNLHPDFTGLPLDGQVALVAQAWHGELPRLLIFDNCENEAVIEAWLPRGGGGRVLVTARRGTWQPELGVKAISLGILTRSESIALLHRHRPDLAEGDPALAAIAAELGDLPLALHLAGAYLALGRHESFGRPAAYLAALRRPDLLWHRSLTLEGRSPTGHEQHVARTFALSWGQLDPAVAADAMARAILARAAWFAAGEPVPRALLRASAGIEDEDDDAAVGFARGLVRVQELGLATPQQDGALVLHRLVAAFLHGVHDTDANEAARAAVEQAVATEAAVLNRHGDPRPLLLWQPQLRAVVEAAARDGRPSAASLLDALGNHLFKIADFDEAIAAFEQSLAIDERTYGSTHWKVAIRLNNLGMALGESGNLERATQMLERALEIDERTWEPDDPKVADVVCNLGIVLQKRKLLDKAKIAFERALAINERAANHNLAKVANRSSNLGMLMIEQRDLNGAKTMFERALEISERNHDPDSSEIARRHSMLGWVLQKMDLPREARVAHERALAMIKRVYVDIPDHPEVAGIVYNRGLMLQQQGDLAGARAAYEQALAIFRSRLGEQHPQTDVVHRALETIDAGIAVHGPGADIP